VITPAVVRLRRSLGFPGTVVVQWGFGPGASRVHRVDEHEESSVVYTATHDNDTALGWWRSLSPAVRRSTGLPGRDPSWEVLDLAWSSRARLAIAPLQDVLGLGSDARMNRPGTVEGNWRWRLRRGALTAELAGRLRQLTVAHRRLTG